MSITAAYQPVKEDWIGQQIIFFPYENVGASAIEVWLETETDVEGTFTRERVAPQNFFALLSGNAPTWAGATIVLSSDYLGAIPDTVDVISIERNTPITQLCDFTNFQPFHMDLIEFAQDKLTMIIQEIAYRKCNVNVTLPISQEITFNAQDRLYASVIDFTLDKLIAYCAQMVSSGSDCTNDLENT